MSKYVWQDAWVLLAVKYAQGESDGASRSEVFKACDFINHSALLDDELAHAIEVFSKSDLMHADGDIFRLGPAFASLWSDSQAEKHRSVHIQLEKLQNALGVS